VATLSSSAGDRSRSRVSAILEELAGRYGKDSVSVRQSVLHQHGLGESHHPSAPPDGVFFPDSTEAVADAVALCAGAEVPIVAYGAGTSLEGHVAALQGGLTLDFARMNRVLHVGTEDLDCRVQPGVTRMQLNRVLSRDGLFFPVDPGADASIGGMVGTGASGTNAVGYGTMRENVLGLTLVLADGRVIHTGGRARKSSAGYDLTRLFVGSEGTLGIITEVILRVRGIPEQIASAVCSFPTLHDAAATAIDAVQQGIPIARVELLDERQMAASAAYSGVQYDEAPTLFLEFHGSSAMVREQAEAVRGFASDHGGSDFEWALDTAERTKLWQARHDAYYAALALRPGCSALTTDVCVPVSLLADSVAAAKTVLENSDLTYTIVGHVGDGNFHAIIVFDPADDDEQGRVHEANEHIVRAAISAGGTCTGEHGVGYGKMPFLREEHGEALAVMGAIKRALDPQQILNPGKIVEPWSR
jgi:D-lactate dehydrogenase (cytochrome)